MEHPPEAPELSDNMLGPRDSAEKRTSLARDRTNLAWERTFAAWMRTGLAAVAAGFVVAKLSEGTEPRWLPVSIGVALIIAGAIVQVAGWWHYRRLMRDWADGEGRGIPSWVITILSLLVVAAAVAGIALVVLPALT